MKLGWKPNRQEHVEHFSVGSAANDTITDILQAMYLDSLRSRVFIAISLLVLSSSAQAQLSCLLSIIFVNSCFRREWCPFLSMELLVLWLCMLFRMGWTSL
jgi:hypothetical protein